MRVTICSNPLLTPRQGLPSLIFHAPVPLKNEEEAEGDVRTTGGKNTFAVKSDL